MAQGLSNGHHKLAATPGLSYQAGLGNSPGFGSMVRAPVLVPQTFHISLPVTAGRNIGYVRNTSDFADSFRVVQATPPNARDFFAFDSEGEVTITPAGVSGLTARRYALLVEAVNDGGVGRAAITIVAAR